MSYDIPLVLVSAVILIMVALFPKVCESHYIYFGEVNAYKAIAALKTNHVV